MKDPTEVVKELESSKEFDAMGTIGTVALIMLIMMPVWLFPSLVVLCTNREIGPRKGCSDEMACRSYWLKSFAIVPLVLSILIAVHVCMSVCEGRVAQVAASEGAFPECSSFTTDGLYFDDKGQYGFEHKPAANEWPSCRVNWPTPLLLAWGSILLVGLQIWNDWSRGCMDSPGYTMGKDDDDDGIADELQLPIENYDVTRE